MTILYHTLLDKTPSPRAPSDPDKCLVVYPNLLTKEFPTLTFDLGKKYRLDGLHVVSMGVAVSYCGMIYSRYLDGIEIEARSEGDKSTWQCPVQDFNAFEVIILGPE